MRNLKASTLAAILLALHPFLPSTAAAQAPGLVVELNKLEADETGCRAWLVFENATGHAFEALTLDFVVFDGEGVISKRLAVNAAPLAADRTSVKAFDLTGLACGDIARLLLNGMTECRHAGGGPEDCMALVSARSKAGVDLVL